MTLHQTEQPKTKTAAPSPAISTKAAAPAPATSAKAAASAPAIYDVIPRVAKGAHVQGMAAYEKEYKRSIENPEAFWGEKAREALTWFHDFDMAKYGGFEKGDVAWFLNGKLNVSTNCIDRHIATRGDKTAILWESDEPGVHRRITYKELLAETCQIANAMLAHGVRKGDTVAIYMPMIPECIMVMLACTRIGAVHSIVFAGFSAEALRDRIIDAQSKWVFTADEGKRGGRTLPLKKTVDEAIHGVHVVKNVFVFKRTNNPKVPFHPKIDVDMTKVLPLMRPYCPAEWMDSEDLMFILYTSGSTGKPKGVAHTTGGYLTYAATTCKYTFDLQEDDVYACVADCGWITGHSYIVYGPLVNGATTVMFESTPMYPDCGRYWDLVERYKITKFYTAPTAIRALMAHGTEFVTKYDRSSLKVLGTVGEPINPEAWKWYFEVVGDKQCMIADTYWQTETGGHIGVGLPGAAPMKAGSCGLPFFGIDFAILDDAGKELVGANVEGRLCIKDSWPGLARTVYGDHHRYLSVYTMPHPGHYFTGDGARRDADGYYWITGRIDDVLSTSGHRIGTAEVESALVAHNVVTEAAVVGFPHRVKGEGICCYITLIHGVDGSASVTKELAQQVRGHIGAFATPDIIVFVPGLPKTRSGKIMRRILRKIAHGEEDSIGDVSTLAEPEVVPAIIDNFKQSLIGKSF
ncbi:acetyl-CoA synthetase [Saprolegnia diclina VS20]|uniref:Acetyl-coenzyme A synthetase n=1 Tax=Saprolegnia diclina (strain VS20) TaxID=1156394 RepID=T0QYR3_SAPDV|nr:acetyl-CoA synthetase [Saprolegnia diclina VS20]EQC39225.1 acetyl-CoA synthetase [Saprolegnia diclina VS20]|eukprot:XP_008607286.1 acetyl-CoA synthetase [Saprolegnia diclina VS20]